MPTKTIISKDGTISKVELSTEIAVGKEDSSEHQSTRLHKEIGHKDNSTETNSASLGSSSYPGDIKEEIPLLDPLGKYQVLPFIHSAQIAATFYDAIREQQIDEATGQKMSLHPWQLDISKELCLPNTKPTAQHPLKYCLVAANGSGKDQFVVAPFAIWFVITKIRSRVILTSSSGTQLTSQTENYIKDLANRINELAGEEVLRIRQRYIFCRKTGSEIRMFATDEEGKAEGYHPLDPGAEQAIIVNEGKSVTEEIHKALKRCSGFNYWIEVSSPGEPKGFLYHAFTKWPLSRRVTSFDCPHISIAEIDDDKVLYGESSAYYRSKHLALFTSMGGETIIPLEIVDRLKENPPSFNLVGSKWVERVGIDLSAGKDETVISIVKGNKQIAEYTWRETDTTITASKIISYLKKHELPKDHDFIYADDGGVGHAIIDMLVNKGWTIKRIHNQSPAINKRHFGNRGAEAYDRVKRLFEESVFNPSTLSDKCINQLTNRKVKDKLEGAKVFLQSKKDAKAHGFESPDRADAFVLSLTGLTIEDFLDATKVENKSISEGGRPLTTRLRTDEVAEWYSNNETYKMYDEAAQQSSKRVFGSLSAAMGTSEEPELVEQDD